MSNAAQKHGGEPDSQIIPGLARGWVLDVARSVFGNIVN